MKQNGIDRNGNRRAAGRVFAFIGGKGGIGKSSIAVNTAIALARRGLRVILLDAARFAHVDIMLDAKLPRDLPIGWDDGGPIEQTLTRGPDGLCVARHAGRKYPPADQRPRGEDCERSVDRLREASDVAVIDCGSGISDRAVSLALLSDGVVLATTPDPTALTDAYATAKVLVKRGFQGTVGLVVNMVRSRREAKRMSRRFQRAAAEFLGLSVQLLGAIPFDRHVVAAARERRPVLVGYPRCAASTCINKISRQLPLGELASAKEAGLWMHAASLFL